MPAPHTQGLRAVRVCWLLIAATALLGAPFGAWELFHRGNEAHVVAWDCAFVLVVVTVPLSLFDIALHLRYLYNPALQVPLVRILWMVPIYAINSYIALRFKSWAIYLNTAREAYEAYVIYSFTVFLMRFVALQGHNQDTPMTHAQAERALNTIVSRKATHSHMFPMCCLRPWKTQFDPVRGCEFTRKVKWGVAQYVVLRVCTTIVAMVLEHLDMLGEGDLSPTMGYFWIALITNFSQIWAMYCLVLFYHTMHDELRPMKPLAKFAVVKAVVFFSFWQSVVIAVLVKTGVIKQNPLWEQYTVADVATGLQDFLMCVEMLLAALCHHYVFSYRSRYLGAPPDGRHVALGCLDSCRALWDVEDVARDVYAVADGTVRDVRRVPRAVKKRFVGTSQATPRERVLEGGGGDGAQEKGESKGRVHGGGNSHESETPLVNEASGGDEHHHDHEHHDHGGGEVDEEEMREEAPLMSPP